MGADALSRTVAVINGKGGVAKTSIVANLGGLLALAGYRCSWSTCTLRGTWERTLGSRTGLTMALLWRGLCSTASR